jgi:hypothetical protein
MKCDHEQCENAPRHTLRSKAAPAQWQMHGKVCEEHLADAVQAVRDQQPALVAGLQVIPFAARDWKPARG